MASHYIIQFLLNVWRDGLSLIGVNLQAVYGSKPICDIPLTSLALLLGVPNIL